MPVKNDPGSSPCSEPALSGLCYAKWATLSACVPASDVPKFIRDGSQLKGIAHALQAEGPSKRFPSEMLMFVH